MKSPITSPLRVAALLSAMSLAPALLAQTGTMQRTDAPHSANLTHGDRTFFEKAAKSGMEEVAVSTGALDRITNPQLKDFAQMMVADHTAVNAELTALAARKGVTLPVKDKSYTAMSDKWSKKTKGVDKDYISQMVDDHQDAVKLFQNASKSSDVEVAAFAQKTLPALQHHLDMAKGLKSAIK